MLPPQLQGGLRRQSIPTSSAVTLRSLSSSIVRATQSRGCWWGRPRDYPSRVDPMFHRFARYRTLKTRAKLLDKLRRRGRWDWDANQQPFFSRKHVRLASHIGRPRWKGNENGDRKDKISEETPEEDGFELSQREKQWKDQMEAMRKRIDQDPYEAVFGKRFEPFWSPLVPTWMREEMGLKDSIKGRSSTGPSPVKPSSSSTKSKSDPINPVERASAEQSKKEPESDGESPNGQLTSYTYTPKKPTISGDPEWPNGQLTNYSYASSSSTVWDSWTKKTRRTEWDSISGKARRWEYDPISNRMVELAEPKSPAARKSQPREAAKEDPMFAAESKSKQADVQPSRPIDNANGGETTVKSSSEAREPIPIPTQSIDSTSKAKTSVYFPSLINTSVISRMENPAVVAKGPEQELDKLTADDVRASVGKTRAMREPATSTQTNLDETRAHRHGKMDAEKSQWDQAESRMMLTQEVDRLTKKRDKMLEQEAKAFHIEGLQKALVKTNARISEAQRQLRRMDTMSIRSGLREEVKHPRERLNSLTQELLQKVESMNTLETTLDRQAKGAITTPVTTKPAKSETLSSLQPSLERMQSKDLPAADEFDDSAAHESTGDRVDYSAPNVPKQWDSQADLLQADRVKRTRATVSEHTPAIDSWTQSQKFHLDKLKQTHSTDKPRWIDIMNARKAKHDVEKAEKKKVVDAKDAVRNAKLAKANAILEAEVNDQQMRMQAYEGRSAHGPLPATTPASTSEHGSLEASDVASERERYRQKIRDLRTELDTAFKQSSVNGEMHVERIRDLEKEIVALKKSEIAAVKFEEERFQQQLNVLKADINRAYVPYVEKSKKQAAQIQELEKKLKEAESRPKTSSTGPEISQAEGDFCANVTKYAKDNSKWYKKPCRNPEATGKPTNEEMDAAAKKAQDHSLVREVKDIYESRYGTIDVNHRQTSSSKLPRMSMPETQVVEVESDVDLGKALADYEQESTYGYRKDSLEAEVAAQEKEAHEAQALMAPESSGKMRQVIADNLALDQDVHGARIIDDKLPKLIPTEITARSEAEKAESATLNEWGIQWEEPPVYTVLAYDSGNDIITTAVTSSNFTNKETPISIQEALSELYQPARFVPHFAELQKDGYQVIYGTKDLLVFKRVKQTPEAAAEKAEEVEHLQDHGLFKGLVNNSSAAAKTAAVNPIDGTSHPIEPSTGSFASPTGFVGDRIFSEGQVQSPSTVSAPVSDDVEFKHYPRVKREERVYSGSRLTKKQKKQQRSEKKEKYQKMRWALWTGLGASAVAYSVGAAVERKEVREKERWEQILEGRNLK